MNISQELSEHQTILLLVPSMEYNDVMVDVAKKLSDKSICYVTLNKTFDSLKEIFEKNGVKTENITFIDGISKTIKNVPDQTSGAYFISSPGALTEISLVVSKFLKHNFEYLIFDSLTNLMVYQSKAPVAKFLSTLGNKIRGSKTKAVFYSLKMEQQEALIQQCSMFVDKVIDLDTK